MNLFDFKTMDDIVLTQSYLLNDSELRTVIASEFFLNNYMFYLDDAIKNNKTDIELAETTQKVSRLSFVIADIFLAEKNRVVGTEEGEEYNYV
jgi:hypothetical protein